MQDHGKFVPSDSADSFVNAFCSTACSRWQAPNPRQFVVIVRPADSENLISTEDHHGNGMLGRSWHKLLTPKRPQPISILPDVAQHVAERRPMFSVGCSKPPLNI